MVCCMGGVSCIGTRGRRRVRSDHCQLITPTTHQCIWLFSLRFVSYITCHLIKGLFQDSKTSEPNLIKYFSLSDAIYEIFIFQDKTIGLVRLWNSEKVKIVGLFLLVDVVVRCRRGRDVWRSKFGVGCQVCKGICQQSHTSLTIKTKKTRNWPYL